MKKGSQKADETAKIKKSVYAETGRMKKLLKDAGIHQKNIEFLHPVIQNTAVMKIKLASMRDSLLEQDPVIDYDNGGGQTGTKENPLFNAYESLWKSYMQGMNKIFDVLQNGKTASAKIETEKKNTLELLLAKRKKDA